MVNELCKVIAKDTGLKELLKSHYIRHSRVINAIEKGVPTEVISENLGYHSIKITEIYLKSFDNSILDEANEIIVSQTRILLNSNRIKSSNGLSSFLEICL